MRNQQLAIVFSVKTPRTSSQTKLLTRTDVAKRLGLSVSTVRRFEKDRLKPVKGADGVNRFSANEVAALAETLVDDAPASPRKSKRRNAAPPAPARTDGDIAAEVFDRLEQRQSLAEIVVGARITPDVVRQLHREWQLGLIQGELLRDVPAVPSTDKAHERHVDETELAQLLSVLPAPVPTRISVARNLGTDFETDRGFARGLEEFGGFIAYGPITIDNSSPATATAAIASPRTVSNHAACSGKCSRSSARGSESAALAPRTTGTRPGHRGRL